MFEVNANILKNRLYITLGRVRKDRVETKPLELVRSAVSKLESGFTCVTRIIDFREVDKNDLKVVKDVQGLLESMGMKRAIRVGVEDGIHVLDEVGKSFNYQQNSAATVPEADKLLDEWEAQLKK